MNDGEQTLGIVSIFWDVKVKDTMSFLNFENFCTVHEYVWECVGEGTFWLALPGRVSSCESKLPAVPARAWLNGERSNRCILCRDTDLKSRGPEPPALRVSPLDSVPGPQTCPLSWKEALAELQMADQKQWLCTLGCGR